VSKYLSSRKPLKETANRLTTEDPMRPQSRVKRRERHRKAELITAERASVEKNSPSLDLDLDTTTTTAGIRHRFNSAESEGMGV
jgi:hypothetical protein